MRISIKCITNNLAWVLIVVMTLGACQKKETLTILSGKLPDLHNDTIALVQVGDYFPGLDCNKKLIVVQTDSIGQFVFKLNQIESGFFQVLNNNYHQLNYDVFLEPGDSIYIEQSSWSEKPQFKIEGKGAEKLSYLTRDFILFPKDKSFSDTIRSNGFKTELIFKSFIDSIQNIRIREINNNKSIPENLKSHFLNMINAEHAKFLLEHLESRNYYMKDEFDYFFPDSSYYSFLDRLKFDNLFWNSTEVKSLANSYLTNKARIAFKEKSEETWWKDNLSWKMNYVAEQPKSDWTDFLVLSTISEYSGGLMLDDFFENLISFDEKVEVLFYSDINRKLFKQNVSDYSRLAPGKPAPDFALPDSSGNLVRLSDFKGKIVYIDFWGTWCYPCIQEIPEALKLQIKYENQPVIFLYVALEYDEENITEWKKFIAGNNERFGNLLDFKPFPGIHLVAEKQFRNEKLRPYKINYAPTHVLIDQNGNIVNPRAERSKSISEYIDKLLIKMK